MLKAFTPVLLLSVLLTAMLVQAAFADDRSDEQPGITAERTSNPRLCLKQGRSDAVDVIAFSPDGRRVATGSGDGIVRCWDALTGTELFHTDRFAYEVTSIAFSPDKRAVAVAFGVFGGSEFVEILDAASGKELRRLTVKGSGMAKAVFSRDSRSVLTYGAELGSREPARLWNAASGEEIRRFVGARSGVSYAAISSDGQQILTVSNTVLKPTFLDVWRIGTGDHIQHISIDHEWIRSAFFSPNGRSILTDSMWGSHLWDIESGKSIATYSTDAGVFSAVFSSDGRFVLTADGNQTNGSFVCLWDAATGKEVRRFAWHDVLSVFTAQFSPDGKRILIISNSMFDKSGHLASFNQDNGVNWVGVWDTVTGKEILRLSGGQNHIKQAVFSPEGNYLLSACGLPADWKVAQIWDAHSGRLLHRLKE